MLKVCTMRIAVFHLQPPLKLQKQALAALLVQQPVVNGHRALAIAPAE